VVAVVRRARRVNSSTLRPPCDRVDVSAEKIKQI